MAANINFLPEEGEDKNSSGQIRKIEFTNPDDAKNNESKPNRLGGVLSFFNRKQKSELPKITTEPPMPPKPQVQPIVKTHVEGKKGPTKTVMVFKEREPEEDTRPPKKPNWFLLWMKKMFSQSPKKVKTNPLDELGSNKEESDKLSFEVERAAQGMPSVPPPPASAPMSAQKTETQKSVPPVILPTNQFQRTAPQVPPKFDPFSPKKEAIPEAPLPPFQPLPPVPGASLPKPAQYTEAKMEQGPASQGLMFDVNLVPDELAQKKRSMSRLTLLGLVAVISIAAVGLAYGILAFYRQTVVTKTIDIDKQIQIANQQISKLVGIQRDALVLKARTDQVETLLNKHVVWEKLFSMLEKYTMTNVQFNKMTVDSNGSLTLEGQSPDADTAFEQLSVLQNATDFVTSVTMSAPSIPQAATDTNTSTSAVSSPSSSVGIPIQVPTTPPPGTTTVQTSSFTLQIILNPSILKQALPNLDPLLP